MIEITIGPNFFHRGKSHEVLEIPHPHPHVGPQVGPTTQLSLPYFKLEFMRAYPLFK